MIRITFFRIYSGNEKGIFISRFLFHRIISEFCSIDWFIGETISIYKKLIGLTDEPIFGIDIESHID